MKRWFGVSADKMYPVQRVNKANFAMDGRDNRPNLLIDDHLKNIQAFQKAGGIGVRHTSASNTIKQLKEIGYK
jgi:hypothetical protein